MILCAGIPATRKVRSTGSRNIDSLSLVVFSLNHHIPIPASGQPGGQTRTPEVCALEDKAHL